MIQPYEFDLVIVGGGPGGSTAAAFARQHGLKVLLVEKEEFPRFHIGESLLPMGNAVMRETGVWPKLAAAGFIQKFGAAFFTSNGRAMTEIQFSEGLVPGLDYTFQVERAKFDALLLDHARELGTEVRIRTLARSVETKDGIHHVRLETGPAVQTVTARWVLDASGRDNLFSTGRKRSNDPSPFPKRIAIYNHFIGVSRASGPAGGHTVAVRLENGWFWLIPIDAERTSVGLVTTVEAMRGAGLRPEDLFARAVAGSAKLRELFAQATPTMPFHVTSDYSYFRQELADERLLLVGDAAGFFDPIFSTGVYMSMWSAKMAVGLIIRADAAKRGLTLAERRRYTKAVKRHAGVFQRLIAMFYDNETFAVFMSQQVPWKIRLAICSIVAGHADMKWSLWWRWRTFLLVCWLQRHGFKMCLKLDYAEPVMEPLSSPANS
ncbi:MAG TPA: NAD(P)/FAD-dependent oxidoreductase [Opitutaceae bacterium]|nr:NAD(P)/FAD-dependent oxidoreductase [Opitutaceae bacterium]